MWPWKHPRSNLEVMERLESLERRFKTLLADVDEYFQLVRRAENRIKNKSATMLRQENGPEGEETPDVAVPGNGSVTSPLLSARQKQIQQMILRRRAGG